MPYNPAWPDQAGQEIRRLRQALGAVALEIHHIGSTAVPGLAAKPTLDFLIVVRSLEALEAREPALVELGYEPRGEAGVVGRRYYRIRDGEAHTRHVHGFAAGHPDIARHLLFRDALRADPDLARAYAALKQALAACFPEDAARYTVEKAEFINEVLNEVLWKSISSR